MERGDTGLGRDAYGMPRRRRLGDRRAYRPDDGAGPNGPDGTDDEYGQLLRRPGEVPPQPGFHQPDRPRTRPPGRFPPPSANPAEGLPPNGGPGNGGAERGRTAAGTGGRRTGGRCPAASTGCRTGAGSLRAPIARTARRRRAPRGDCEDRGISLVRDRPHLPPGRIRSAAGDGRPGPGLRADRLRAVTQARTLTAAPLGGPGCPGRPGSRAPPGTQAPLNSPELPGSPAAPRARVPRAVRAARAGGGWGHRHHAAPRAR